MLAVIHSAMSFGLSPYVVDVEVDVSGGLNSFSLIGLPDKAVEEAKDRILSAIKNSKLRPEESGSYKTVVSLAPADLKKEGAHFDLAIALGYLLARRVLTFDTKRKLFLGELGLGGEVRSVRGTLIIVQMARDMGFSELYVPRANTREAGLVRGITIFGVDTLVDLVRHLDTRNEFSLTPAPLTELTAEDTASRGTTDFAHVRGQESAKRGLEIAAAGRHNIALSGPPGTGKTLLAKAFAGILPNLSEKEILETTGIHSVAGILRKDFMTNSPFRAPHHTSSHVSIIGGGANPRPGEITLAHNGVLFLDEFPEFERRVIEGLRQPLEDRVVSIARARGTVHFPAHFILVATMNPCPCGNRGNSKKECTCTQSSLLAYQRKISGPIVDRIDMWVEVPNVDLDKLAESVSKAEPSVAVQERVSRARTIQHERFKNERVTTNSEMGVNELDRFAMLGTRERALLKQGAEKLGLSARGYHRVQKLARTIADLDDSNAIKTHHVLEALTYRPKQSP